MISSWDWLESSILKSTDPVLLNEKKYIPLFIMNSYNFIRFQYIEWVLPDVACVTNAFPYSGNVSRCWNILFSDVNNIQYHGSHSTFLINRNWCKRIVEWILWHPCAKYKIWKCYTIRKCNFEFNTLHMTCNLSTVHFSINFVYEIVSKNCQIKWIHYFCNMPKIPTHG